MRALLFAILAQGNSRIENVLMAPDTVKLIEIAHKLGARVEISGNQLFVTGTGGHLQPVSTSLDIGNSGILRRFLTAILSTQPHRYTISGDASVMARPMKDLQHALECRGVQFFEDGSFQGPFQPGTVHINGRDSQPVSALLIAAALTSGESFIEVSCPGETPWVDMTLSWLNRLHVTYERQGYYSFTVQGKALQGFNYKVPGDYSSAAFPYVGGIITQGRIDLEGLTPDESQGDQLFLDMDILEGGEFDLNQCIDAVPIAAVKACFAKDLVVLVDIGVARTKECDRLHAISTELNKMGGQVYALDDALVIKPSPLVGAKVDSHGDHRIAMALAIAGCAAAGRTEIVDTGCISKTYPDFIGSFRALGASIEIK
jgi:3-phosphoshikimate 1-carboxyvinyltransferase